MIIDEIRRMLVDITGRADLADVAPDSPLLHDPVGLDSLGGMRLLRAVKDVFGVDVAAEDLNLDSLASVDSLVRYIADNRGDRADEAGDRLHAPTALYVVDGQRVDGLAPGLPTVETAAREAVGAGEGTVISSSNVVFDNGAVTLVMILAESHLSIHTWPETGRVAIDLFCCGSMNGRATIDLLAESLNLSDVSIRKIDRG